MSLSIYWPNNVVQFKGKSISVAWREEMQRLGWKIQDTPQGADLAFFISDSMIDEAVLGTMPTIG